MHISLNVYEKIILGFIFSYNLFGVHGASYAILKNFRKDIEIFIKGEVILERNDLSKGSMLWGLQCFR